MLVRDVKRLILVLSKWVFSRFIMTVGNQMLESEYIVMLNAYKVKAIRIMNIVYCEVAITISSKITLVYSILYTTNKMA